MATNSGGPTMTTAGLLAAAAAMLLPGGIAAQQPAARAHVIAAGGAVVRPRIWGQMSSFARIGLLAALLLVALGALACHPLGPSSPVMFTLEPGEAVRIERTTVRFVEVVSDSRCPLNALCVQQGDVVVEIELTVGGSDDTFELALNDPSRNPVVFRDIVVTLEAVEPYPAGSPIEPDEYRATFEVARE
jgi:hypothetical protein